MTQLDVQHLYFNAEYEVNEKRRDNEVKHWCRHQRISISQFHDQCIVKPGTVLTQQGQAFKVFSPFKRAWINLADNRIATPLAQPLKRPLTVQKALFKLCSAQANNALLNYLEDPLWPISEDEAQNRLNEFVAERAEAYQQLRDLPAANATSRLSTYLSLGLLSPLQCLQTAMLHNQGLLISGNQGFDSWVNELIWRDFYRHLLVAFPKLSMHKAFKEPTEKIKWRNSKDRKIRRLNSSHVRISYAVFCLKKKKKKKNHKNTKKKKYKKKFIYTKYTYESNKSKRNRHKGH